MSTPSVHSKYCFNSYFYITYLKKIHTCFLYNIFNQHGSMEFVNNPRL